jgi:flagellar FliL protein
MSEAAEEKAPAAPAGIPMKMVIIIVAGVLVLGLGWRLCDVQNDGRMPPGRKRMAKTVERRQAAHGAGRRQRRGAMGPSPMPVRLPTWIPFIVNLADSRRKFVISK